jgi:tetrahydromethanopterin S-methyltransferase subunit D
MELTEKLGIVGVVLGVVGGGIAWWAFYRAANGRGSYDVAWIALVICLIGLSLVFFVIRKWWIAD